MAESDKKIEKKENKTPAAAGSGMTPETEQSIVQLQNAQRQLQMLASQRQRFEFEVVQADTALAELEKAEGKTYKSIGTLFLESKPTDIKEELDDRRAKLNARIDTMKTQEDRIKSKSEELQKKLEKEIGGAKTVTAA